MAASVRSYPDRKREHDDEAHDGEDQREDHERAPRPCRTVALCESGQEQDEREQHRQERVVVAEWATTAPMLGSRTDRITQPYVVLAATRISILQP